MSAMSESERPLAITLVGYGKYGKLITNKYMVQSNLYHLAAVIDPTFQTEHLQLQDLELRTSTNTTKVIAFKSFERWHRGYYTKLSDVEQARIVVDVAVHPDICFGLVSKFVETCKNLTWMVLPKPVVKTKTEIQSLVELMNSHHVKAAVASQWAYSPLPKLIRDELKKAANEHHCSANTIELNFTKENGHSYGTHPPLLELPHCLQILHSSAIVNYHDGMSPDAPIHRSITGTEDYVIVCYNLGNGVNVKVKCDLNHKPTPSERLNGCNASRTDYQIRTLTATSDTSGTAILDVDFWVHFDKTGKRVLREGRFQSFCSGANYPVAEDQLGTMIQQVYCAIWECRHDPSLFESHNGVMTINEYLPICEEIMDIEQDWKKHVDTHHGFKSRTRTSLRRPSLDLVSSPPLPFDMVYEKTREVKVTVD